MAAWVDLAALHNPAAGQRPPAAWGDGINSNMDYLSGTAAAYVGTSQSSTSLTYVDLATTGPTVTVDTGASALVSVGCTMNNNTQFQYILMAFAVSGASSIAATDDSALYRQQPDASGDFSASKLCLVTGLTPGTNIFTAKYRVTGGTGGWYRRTIAVFPLR